MIHLILSLLAWTSAVSGIQTPRAYDAQWTSGRIVINGRLDDPSWARAPWTDDFVDILGGDAPTPFLRTRAKILWDDQYLYVCAEMEEPHLWATLLERDAIIYQDDDFEVFLDPDGDGSEYFEVEVNAYGTVLDLFMDKPYNKRGSATIDWDMPGLRAGVFWQGTLNNPSNRDEGWSVELAIPWEDLVPPESQLQGSPPRPGDQWRINFSRVDWPVEVSDSGYDKAVEAGPENRHPESNWVWSPQGAIDMHIPELWGVVRFVKEPGESLEFFFQ